MESKVFSLFQISLENFFKTKFYLAHHIRLQPSEIEALPYYEYWYYVKHLTEHLKGQDSANRKEQDKYEEQSNDMKSQAKMPKMPNYGNFNAGSMKMPSVKLPKL